MSPFTRSRDINFSNLRNWCCEFPWLGLNIAPVAILVIFGARRGDKIGTQVRFDRCDRVYFTSTAKTEVMLALELLVNMVSTKNKAV